jgi:hypothetical protein
MMTERQPDRPTGQVVTDQPAEAPQGAARTTEADQRPPDSPQDFYRKATERADVREILKRLADR